MRLQFERFRGFIEEFSANLSLGGMFIRTDDPPEVGTELPIEFRLGEDYELIRGRGRVVWVRAENQGPERPAGMGIRFLELTPGSRELIFKMVERRVREGGDAFDLEAEADLLPDRPPEPGPGVEVGGGEADEAEPEREPDREPEPMPVLGPPSARGVEHDPDPETLPPPPRTGPTAPRETSATGPPSAAAAASAAAAREPVPDDRPEAAVLPEVELEAEPEPEVEPELEAEAEPDVEPEPDAEPEPPPRFGPNPAGPAPGPVTPVVPSPAAPPPRRSPLPPLAPREPDSGPLSESDLLAAVTPSQTYATGETGFGVAAGQEDDTGSPRRILFILLPLCVALLGAAWLLRERYLPRDEPVDTGPTVLWDAQLRADETEPADQAERGETATAGGEERGAVEPVAGERSAAAETASAAPAQGGRVSRVDNLTWTREEGRTVLVVWADAPLAAGDVVDFRLDGGAPRHVVRILGVEEPYSRERVAVGTEQVEQVRTGLHTDRRPSELHLVLDLARADAEVRLEPVGNRLRIVVQGESS